MIAVVARSRRQNENKQIVVTAAAGFGLTALFCIVVCVVCGCRYIASHSYRANVRNNNSSRPCGETATSACVLCLYVYCATQQQNHSSDPDQDSSTCSEGEQTLRTFFGRGKKSALRTSPEIANTPPALTYVAMFARRACTQANLELIFHDVGPRPVVSHNLDCAHPQRQLV